MYRWYTLARQHNLPVSRPMLEEEARVIAARLGHHQLKVSNGWLESFKKYHNIRRFTFSVEAADVSEETYEGRHERAQSFMVDINQKMFGTRTKLLASIEHFQRRH